MLSNKQPSAGNEDNAWWLEEEDHQPSSPKIAAEPIVDQVQSAAETLVQAGSVDINGSISRDPPVAKRALEGIRRGQTTGAESIGGGSRPSEKPNIQGRYRASTAKQNVENRQFKIVFALVVFRKW